MKKILFLLVSITSLFFFSCASTDAAADTSAPAEEPKEEVVEDEVAEEVTIEELQEIVLTNAESYTVVRGDTLSKISDKFYNEKYLFPLIALANDLDVNPDFILPQMTLVIPMYNENMNNVSVQKYLKGQFARFAEMYGNKGYTEARAALQSISDKL